MPEVWFWQRIVSPHMVGLAKALATQGFVVHYAFEQLMSPDRAKFGWKIPDSDGLYLHHMHDYANVVKTVSLVNQNSHHICQGIRANGRVGIAQNLLSERGLRQWIVMETVDDKGWRGFLKRLEYKRQFLLKRERIEGVLAIGHNTTDWVVARGMPADRVFPFAYFLIDSVKTEISNDTPNQFFRFIFVGQFIELKRLGMLIDALSNLNGQDFELIVVGAGPLEEKLRRKAETIFSHRLTWLGKLPSTEVSAVIAQADCLVLPSIYDGWGAVVSEALMVGTPVICSNTCGSAGVVRFSGVGGVFDANDQKMLIELLEIQLTNGQVDYVKRNQLSTWAARIGATAGALYLKQILESVSYDFSPPSPPWTM